MTRKHLKALAEIVKGIKNDTERERTAKLMAGFCAGQNPLFNRSKFLEACNCPMTTLNTYLTETDLELAS